jgi:hypothetical protein
LQFDESRVGEWESMVRGITAALDEAYRGSSRPDAAGSGRDYDRAGAEGAK